MNPTPAKPRFPHARKPDFGAYAWLSATNFLGHTAQLTVHAQLTPSCIKNDGHCSVTVCASAPPISISLPDMTAAQARELAAALLVAADEADRIDAAPVELEAAA